MRTLAQDLSSLPNILSTAIPYIRWPLDPSFSPPLYFQPLDSMKEIRHKGMQREQNNDVRLARSHPLVSNLPKSIEDLFPLEKIDDEKRNFGLISLSLILLGNGMTDEAHDLVTPLSWPEDTYFGFGPSVYATVSPATQSYATYAHCLIHRREGPHYGELGMRGWGNANYWSRAVLQSPGVKELPHKDWLDQLNKLLNKFSDSPEVQAWGKSHGFLSKSRLEKEETYYESRAVHQLCAQAMSANTGSNNNKSVREFAEQVAEMEVRVLLAHSLIRAGFECSLEDILSAQSDAASNS